MPRSGTRTARGSGPIRVLFAKGRLRDTGGTHYLLESLPRLYVSGLMTIPRAGDLAAARGAYRALRELAHTHGLSELSMGMSDDLEIAIAEGATRVRVGTALFGPRPT